MMAQGTDGLSRGVWNEGVMRGGSDMLEFVDIAKSAIDRSYTLLEYVISWTEPTLEPLTPEEWFQKGHDIIGGRKDSHGIWIPDHAKGGRIYLWAPPPSLGECYLGGMFARCA